MINVCCRLSAASDSKSFVFHGERDVRVGEGDPQLVGPDLEEPVEPGSFEDRLVGVERVLPVVTRTTRPPIRRRGSSSGAGRSPPAFWASASRSARLCSPPVGSVPGSGGGRARGLLPAAAHAAPPRLRLARNRALRPPPIIATPSSSSETPGGNSPTISPSKMTRMRSESEDLLELERDEQHARPSSRSSTSRRWTNSIAPTSRPRVGCAAISTLGLRSISRARMTFCWLPPESPPARVCGPPPRTSNSRISFAAFSISRRG